MLCTALPAPFSTCRLFKPLPHWHCFQQFWGGALKLLWMLEGGICISKTLLCLGSQRIGAALCLMPRHPTFLTTSGSQTIPDPVSLASAVLSPDSWLTAWGMGDQNQWVGAGQEPVLGSRRRSCRENSLLSPKDTYSMFESLESQHWRLISNGTCAPKSLL